MPTAVASTQETPRRFAAPSRLPAGYHLSTVWLDRDGLRVDGAEKIPVNSTTLRPGGTYWLCTESVNGCDTHEWTFGQAEPDETGKNTPDPEPEEIFCRRHGIRLVAETVDPSQPAPVAGAQRRLADRVTAALKRRREVLAGIATAKMLQARAAVEAAGRRTAADYAEHAPTLGAAALTITGAVTLAETGDPLMVAAAACTFAVAGGVLAYALAYLLARYRAHAAGDRFTGGSRAARTARAQARTLAAATAAGGLWTAADAGAVALGWGQGTVPGTLMLGAAVLTAWLLGRGYWTELSDTRRRLRAEAVRKAAEAAQRLQEQAEKLVEEVDNPPPPPEPEIPFDENDPRQVGERMARRWEDIAAHPDAGQRFAVMARTRILPELTRAVTAPTPDGTVRRIGWEFMIQGEPGVLVPSIGAPSPLLHAKPWLAAMLGRDPISVAVVERPDNDINRGVLLLTDGAPLGEPVPYLGRAGIQRLPNGTILGHDGRTITGKDTFYPLYIPGQTFGGMIIGTSGGGKSQSVRVSRLLNNLYAGIFSTLYDPKNFIDYSEFAGVIPMGCTVEHRDVIMNSLWAEMVRRQRMLSQLVGKDRHGRKRPVEGAWRIERDGPPVLSIWDEFHLEITDKDFVAVIAKLCRLQRATASGVLVATQGGGLKDLGDSVLRDLLCQAGLEVYRMRKDQAKLGGYNGLFDPMDLPRLAGTLLKISGDAGPIVPMRSAFVTREDVDGSVYDHLYAPDGSQILSAPELPAETLEVFRREGLMDLWEMGKGEGGVTRLQAGPGDSTTPPPGAIGAPAGKPSGKPMEARDVILAAFARGPIPEFGHILRHPMWLEDPNRSALPVPSTISRAARDLKAEGVLRDAPGKDAWLELTPQGQQLAERALLAFEIAVGHHDQAATGAATRTGETIPDLERRIDQEQEEQRLLAQQIAESKQDSDC